MDDARHPDHSIPMDLIYTIDQAASILGCTQVTAVHHIMRGDLPGLKFGRSWIIPAHAFHQRLNEFALETAAERRMQCIKPRRDPVPIPIPVPTPSAARSRRRIPPPLPPVPTSARD